jgi:succinate dehydrogenase / fumarate reductase, iron-sulfur subunit
MNFTLKIWRQKDSFSKGRFESYDIEDISPDCSFLEMLDILNSRLTDKIEKPVVWEDDCREGICGSCGLYINGRPHGPDDDITTCQLHMRKFKDGDIIIVEPWRAWPFPVIKDLVADRSSFDRIISAGGYISVNTGGAPEANSIPVSRAAADTSMDAAACISCGACVAACKNASAMLFVAAKVSHLARLPQGMVEAKERVRKMVGAMDKQGFGNCTNTGACEAECPKNITLVHIAKLNREYYSAKFS